MAKRDLRDPRALGVIYMKMRQLGADIADCVLMPAQNYFDGKWISNDPSKHHSRVDQRQNWQEGSDNAV